MDYNKIYAAVIDVYRKCEIHSFPFHCDVLLELYKYELYSYKQLRERDSELYRICTMFSEDAFHDQQNHLILYNDEMPKNRIRFSLMHELGHIVLEHHGDTDVQEREANAFAGMILCPSMTLHYSKLRTPANISSTFRISYSAAIYALRNYERWYHHVMTCKMSELDKRMYQHFYNESYHGYVWSSYKCPYCGKMTYNSPGTGCRYSRTHTPHREPEACSMPYSCPDGYDLLMCEQRAAFLRAENHWLYADLY